MKRLVRVPLLLMSLLILMMLPSAQSIFAQEETPSDTSPSELLSEKIHTAAQLLIGNFPQQSAQSIDISYLSPFGTEKITVIEHGYLPDSGGPAAYWLLELENVSVDYLKPKNVINYLGIRQETAEGMRDFVEMRSVLYAAPNAQWAPPVDEDTLRMAPGAIWQIHLSTSSIDPFSDYTLVNRLIDEDINVGLPEASQEERIFNLMMTDPNFLPDDYQATLESLTTEITELKQEIQAQALTDFDQNKTTTLEKESLNQSITDQLTLLEHGVEESADQVQAVAYWIFKVSHSDQDDESSDSTEADETETNDSTGDYRFISEDLWPFKGIQGMPNMPQYTLPLEITLVVPTETGAYMPLEQPSAQAAAPENWQGYLKLSFPIGSQMYEHYLDYQGERFDLIGDWGESAFN